MFVTANGSANRYAVLTTASAIRPSVPGKYVPSAVIANCVCNAHATSKSVDKPSAAATCGSARSLIGSSLAQPAGADLHAPSLRSRPRDACPGRSGGTPTVIERESRALHPRPAGLLVAL